MIRIIPINHFNYSLHIRQLNSIVVWLFTGYAFFKSSTNPV